MVRDPSNTQAQIHAAGTIRNLAAGELIQVGIELKKIKQLLETDQSILVYEHR